MCKPSLHSLVVAMPTVKLVLGAVVCPKCTMLSMPLRVLVSSSKGVEMARCACFKVGLCPLCVSSSLYEANYAFKGLCLQDAW